MSEWWGGGGEDETVTKALLKASSVGGEAEIKAEPGVKLRS